MRELTLSIALIILTAAGLSGQTQDSLRVLALPEGQPFSCRTPEQDAANTLPSQFIAGEYMFGSPPAPDRPQWSREITVAFDSIGRVLILTDERSFGRLGSQSVFARLDSTGTLKGTRTEVTVDSAALENAGKRRDARSALAALRPPVTRPLTADETKQLSALTEWLWTHRCPPRLLRPKP
jgi:hypothetical protein